MEYNGYMNLVFKTALNEDNPEQLHALDEAIALVALAIKNLEEEDSNRWNDMPHI